MGSTQYLSRVFLTAKDPKFADTLADVLEKEYRSMPKDFIGVSGAKTELDSLHYQMRQARLQALADAAGQARNRKALPTLRKMLANQGAPRAFAVGAIGQISDPADIEDFIQRIKKDPKSNITLNSFGPAAVDPIMREVNDPAVPELPKYTIANSLRYMATHDNMGRYRQLLKHKDPVIQRVSAEAICRIAGKDDGDALIEITHSNWSASRGLAIRAMGRNSDERFIPVLRNMVLHDDSGSVRAETTGILEPTRS